MWTSLLSLFLLAPIVSSLDYFSIFEDYARNVKQYNTITLLSCSTDPLLNGISWANRQTDRGYFFQYLDVSEGFNLTRVEMEINCRQLFVINLNCPKIQDIIAELSNQGQFNSLCRSFFLFDPKEEQSSYDLQLHSILSNTEFTFNSDVVYGTVYSIGINDNSSSRQEFLIYDLWNPGRRQGGSLKVDLIGWYDFEGPDAYQFHSTDILPEAAQQRRLNLTGLHLECAIVVTSPFNDTLENYITHNYNPYLDTVHRLNFRTINLVQDYFNFQLHVKRTHSWGYVQNASSATTFDGMVGMVQRNEVDFGCSPAWFRTERLEVVDYGAQTWAIRPIFLFRHPNTRGLGKNVFLEPFDDSVWTMLAVCSVIIVLLVANSVQHEKSVLGKISQDITNQVV